jgi:hypothetical protein
MKQKVNRHELPTIDPNRINSDETLNIKGNGFNNNLKEP